MNLSNTIKKHIARTIIVLFPRSKWYKAAHTIAGMLARWREQEKYKYKNTVAMSHAGKLNGLLALMTRTGKPFPIPVRAQGLDLFFKPRPHGLILCSTHIPLSKVALRHLMEQGFTPTLALAANPGVINSVAVWGSIEKIPAIRTGPFVLQKTKRVLEQGGSIVVLVDRELGGPYSPNIFRLAEKINTDIVFFGAVLRQDGVVDVSFRESEWNGNVNRVDEQLNELYNYTATLLQQYDNSGYLHAPC